MGMSADDEEEVAAARRRGAGVLLEGAPAAVRDVMAPVLFEETSLVVKGEDGGTSRDEDSSSFGHFCRVWRQDASDDRSSGEPRQYFGAAPFFVPCGSLFSSVPPPASASSSVALM